jgi:hydroxymethylbilane synthase
MKITIGSRGSELALWQANHIKDLLESNGHQIEIKIIVTAGDRIQDLGFDKMEGKGFFTKEIEEALMRKEIDLAVHSLKDLETTSPAGLELAAISKREDPSDVMLIGSRTAVRGETVLKLAPNSVVGTSSARRKSQLIALRPDLRIRDLRGNVPTRLKKLRAGEYDAILLAAAGIARLKLDTSDLLVNVLEPMEFVPAPGQGALGLQIRTEDAALKAAIQCVNHAETAAAVMLEREVLRNLDGGCQLPLGAYCTNNSDGWTVTCAYSKSAQLPAVLSKHTSRTSNGFGRAIAEKLRRG